MRRRAFTLVELLVVIGIIAVLIAILLPTMERVREQALRVNCMSNVRQMVAASIMYAHDKKVFPPVTEWNQRVWIKDGRTPEEMINNNRNLGPAGVGLLVALGYLPQSEMVVKRLLFCPSARTTSMQMNPNTVWGLLDPEKDPWRMVSGDGQITYAQHFATCQAKGNSANPLAPPMTLVEAHRESPILLADYVFNGQDPRGPTNPGVKQAHRGEGLVCGFTDGSVQWIKLEEVFPVHSSASNGLYANGGGASHFWWWARRVYGKG